MVTLKSSSDRERPFGVTTSLSIAMQIVYCMVELVCRFFVSRLKINVVSRCQERAMISSLTMNRMARMPEMLEPIGRPSFWRKT